MYNYPAVAAPRRSPPIPTGAPPRSVRPRPWNPKADHPHRGTNPPATAAWAARSTPRGPGNRSPSPFPPPGSRHRTLTPRDRGMGCPRIVWKARAYGWAGTGVKKREIRGAQHLGKGTGCVRLRGGGRMQPPRACTLIAEVKMHRERLAGSGTAESRRPHAGVSGLPAPKIFSGPCHFFCP